LARYKLPRAVHFVQQLPRTASGKLMRRELPALLSNS
jgi:O-succinylbenzoic acid--CoA ligase